MTEGFDTLKARGKENGAPGWTRTNDLRFRRPLLYPAELQAPAVTVRVSLFALKQFPSVARTEWPC